MPKTRFLGVGLRKYISLYYYNDYRIHCVYFFYFFRDRPRFTRGFRKHLSKSMPHQALPRALSKNQTCFKGLRPTIELQNHCPFKCTLKIRPAIRDSLKSVPPCTLLRASFCSRKNSLLHGTTPVHGRSETELRKKHHGSTFYSEPSFGTKTGS